jgi:hypothetical protein
MGSPTAELAASGARGQGRRPSFAADRKSQIFLTSLRRSQVCKPNDKNDTKRGLVVDHTEHAVGQHLPRREAGPIEATFTIFFGKWSPAVLHVYELSLRFSVMEIWQARQRQKSHVMCIAVLAEHPSRKRRKKRWHRHQGIASDRRPTNRRGLCNQWSHHRGRLPQRHQNLAR